MNFRTNTSLHSHIPHGWLHLGQVPLNCHRFVALIFVLLLWHSSSISTFGCSLIIVDVWLLKTFRSFRQNGPSDWTQTFYIHLWWDCTGMINLWSQFAESLPFPELIFEWLTSYVFDEGPFRSVWILSHVLLNSHGSYARPVMAFGYCHRLRLSVCVYVCVCPSIISLSGR